MAVLGGLEIAFRSIPAFKSLVTALHLTQKILGAASKISEEGAVIVNRISGRRVKLVDQ